MSSPILEKNLRDAPQGEQSPLAGKLFGELLPNESAEYLASVPLYGFCIGLLEGGHKFSWKQLDDHTWRVSVKKAPYPSLNQTIGVHHPNVLPESSIVCVTDREERVWLVDANRRQVLGDIVAGGGASHLAVHPEGRFVYVACPWAGEVAVVDAKRKEKVTAIPVGKGGQLPNFSPDGKYAVIDCSQTSDVYLMDSERHHVVFSKKVGLVPHEAIFTPDGRFICVPCAAGELYLIPTENPDRSTVIPCGFGAGHIDFSADGRYAYMAHSLDDDLAIIDLTTQELVTRVPAGAGAHRPSLNEDNSLLFVANFVADTLTVIDTRLRAVVTTIPVGTYPHDVVRAPGARMAVCSYGSGTCTLIDRAEPEAKVELKIGKGTSHCTFLPEGKQAFFANSLSGDLAVVDLDQPKLRASIPVVTAIY